MLAFVSSPAGPIPKETDAPKAGPGTVVVKTRAAACNRADLAMLTGAAHGPAGGMGMPLGLEWAGEVVEVGPGVASLQVGDRIMGASPGAFSEFVVAYPAWIYRMPDGLSFEQAAALPVSLQTMHDALVTNGQLATGQSVLIQGASAAMGLMGMQIARLMGASTVIGSSKSVERRARLTSYGADVTIDTRDADWVTQVRKATTMTGVDLTIDLLAGPLINDTVQATRIGGRIVNVGRMAGESGEFNFDQHSMRRITYVGVTFRTRSPAEIAAVIAAASRELLPALADGRLKMPLDHVFPLSEIDAAFARMRENRHFGKIVLDMAARA